MVVGIMGIEGPVALGTTTTKDVEIWGVEVTDGGGVLVATCWDLEVITVADECTETPDPAVPDGAVETSPQAGLPFTVEHFSEGAKTNEHEYRSSIIELFLRLTAAEVRATAGNVTGIRALSAGSGARLTRRTAPFLPIHSRTVIPEGREKKRGLSNARGDRWRQISQPTLRWASRSNSPVGAAITSCTTRKPVWTATIACTT